MRSVAKNPVAQAAALAALAVVLRLVFLQVTGIYGQVYNNDGVGYNRIAASLLTGQGFAWGPAQPTAFRPFGYPWLLAAIYAVFGHSSAALQWAQALMGGLLVIPVYALARRLGGAPVAVIAALGVALHPVLIYLTGLTAPDAAAILCEMTLLYLALRYAQHRKSKAIAAGLVLVGAAQILLRPELLLVVLLLPVPFIAVYGFSSYESRAILIIAVLAVLLATLPPALRNRSVLHAFTPFPTIGGVTFWGGNNAAANGGWLMPDAGVWQDGEPPALGMQGWPELTEQESQSRFYAASWRWIRQNPGAFAALIPRKLARAWTLSYADESRSRALPPVVDWLNAVFGLIVLIGIVMAVRQGDERLLLLLLFVPVVAWAAKTAAFYGSARLTAMVLPVLCIFAAVAIKGLAAWAASVLGRRGTLWQA